MKFRVVKVRGACNKSIFWADNMNGCYLSPSGHQYGEYELEYLGEWIDSETIEDIIKINTESVNKVITITTQEMFDNYTSVVYDCPEMFEHKGCSEDLVAIANGDIEKIRHMFQEGSTPLLLGTKMDKLEKIGEFVKPEIRIIYRKELIGVIIHTEINY